MFTRVVELTAKSGKSRELCNALRDKVQPILRRFDGFRDWTLLVSNSDPNSLLALSFWNSPEDAERYNKDGYSEVLEAIGNFIERKPTLKTYHVDISTSHHIAGKAA